MRPNNEMIHAMVMVMVIIDRSINKREREVSKRGVCRKSCIERV